MSISWRRFALCLTLPALATVACVQAWTPAVRAPGPASTAGPVGVPVPSSGTQPVSANGAPVLKVHLNNRQLWILSEWQEDTAAKVLTGTGQLFDVDRLKVQEGPMRAPFDSIALLESYGSYRKGSFGIGLLAVWTAGTGIITGSCLADPKSCFGSCPTFYVDGDTGVVQAEGFSGSPLRVLEERDVDHLFRLDPPPGPFVVHMRNEAMETHAVRSVRVHLANRPANGRVYHASDDTFRPATRESAPIRCTAANGDCLAPVRAMDSAEWSSRTDSTDLGTRETVELSFAPVDVALEAGEPATVGLVIGGRNTLVSTFLFYQALAYAGSRAGELLAALERGTRNDLPPVFATLREMATIHVQVARDGEPWRSAGSYLEAGPIATDVRVLPIVLPPGRGAIRIRLDLSQGFWRLNQLSLARLGDPVPVTTLEPVAVDQRAAPTGPTIAERAGHAIAAAWNPLTALVNAEQHLITYPGDEYALRFVLPPRDHGAAREVFLESTGYYYEWMRTEWLPEENAIKAAQLLYAPAAALKALAAQFKQREAGMDSIFWQSRVGRIAR